MRRREWSTPLGSLVAAFLAIGYVVIMVLVAVKFDHPIFMLLAFELLFVAIAALSLRSAIRIPRAGLRISPEGVTVRGLFGLGSCAWVRWKASSLVSSHRG